jgi:nicotinate-nucleotide adenylyltransferase
MAKIGLYAGTFDPVHDGHIAFARAALDTCALDEVIFLPEPQPRGKQGVTPIAKRVDMLRLAVAKHDGMDVHMLPDAQFTVAITLPKLRAMFGNDITLLVGSDVARGLPHWPGAKDLLATVHIAVGMRADDQAPALSGSVTFVPTTHAHVAASLVRQGVSQAILPEVSEYIRKNQLYVV